MNKANSVHTPVMLQEVIEFLNPAPGKKYLDATLGAAGHTLQLLQKGATVVGIDRDQDILDIAHAKVTELGLSNRFTAVHSAFSDYLGATGSADFDGILFDLGVSSMQLDTPARGFSFRYDAPLDMRMDKSLGVTAADLINGLGKKELIELFTTLGEDRNSHKIVGAILRARKLKPITRTKELVAIIESVVTSGHTKIHPATRIFQALRMAVNTEREELKAALPSALSWLRQGGLIAIITFQSLEEAIVNDFFKTQVELGNLKLVSSSPLTPSESEILVNPRSRSAKLHRAEYLGAQL